MIFPTSNASFSSWGRRSAADSISARFSMSLTNNIPRSCWRFLFPVLRSPAGWTPQNVGLRRDTSENPPFSIGIAASWLGFTHGRNVNARKSPAPDCSEAGLNVHLALAAIISSGFRPRRSRHRASIESNYSIECRIGTEAAHFPGATLQSVVWQKDPLSELLPGMVEAPGNTFA